MEISMVLRTVKLRKSRIISVWVELLVEEIDRSRVDSNVLVTTDLIVDFSLSRGSTTWRISKETRLWAIDHRLEGVREINKVHLVIPNLNCDTPFLFSQNVCGSYDFLLLCLSKQWIESTPGTEVRPIVIEFFDS